MTTGLPLIVMRPEPGNAATVARATAAGLDARAMPLFAARSLPWSHPDARDFDALLLTSAQAARLAGSQLSGLAVLPVLAIGEATATAAADAGLTVAVTGDSDAQQLLDGLTPHRFQRILWLCGRDRSVFEARGAALAPLPVYAVDPIAPPPGWADLISAPAVVMAHSTRAAARIADLAGAGRKHLTLLAISRGAAAAAGDGWAEVTVSERPDDAAMLAEAHALCHKSR